MLELFNKAAEIVWDRSEEKERMYGPMEEGMYNSSLIAKNLMKLGLSPKYNSFVNLISLKLSRERYNHKEDNILDAIAYTIGLLTAYGESKEDITNEVVDLLSKFNMDDLMSEYEAVCGYEFFSTERQVIMNLISTLIIHNANKNITAFNFYTKLISLLIILNDKSK